MGLTLDGVNGISATGNIISSQGFISATGNIYAGNLITALSTTGNVSGANILATGIISSTGAATHSSLTLGTPLSVANGGTGATTLSANNVLLGNGTDAPQTVAPGTSGYALRSNGSTWAGAKLGLGMTGEVWNNVAASRAAGTTYTNSNSYPIMVAVGLRASSAGPTATSLFVNGVTVANANFSGWTGTGCWPASAIVPPGGTYSVTSGWGLYYWAELY